MPACITPAIAGRGLTSYLPHCELEAQLKQAMGVNNDTEYRRRLQSAPKDFDTVAKSFIPFFPYWPVSPCPSFRHQ